MSRQIGCKAPICSNLGIKTLNLRQGLTVAERFRAPDDGPTSARRQRVDPEVEIEEARVRLSEEDIEKTLERIKKFYCFLGTGFVCIHS